MATPTTTTRRAAIASMAGAAFTATVPPVSAGAPFNPVPTRLGRKYLHHLGQIRFLWEHMPAEDHPRYEACQDRDEHHHAELDRLKSEIESRPVRSAADMVDRLIVVNHGVSWLDGEEVWLALDGALAAAGLTRLECSEGPMFLSDDAQDA